MTRSSSACSRAAAAVSAFPAYVRNAELNIQVHGGIGFTWEHDAHLHLRRAMTLRAVLGGDGPAADLFDLTAAGVTRSNSLDLPASAEELRAGVRADAAEIAKLDGQPQLDRLIATGYVMPHWPKPWGRAADAVEQLVIEQEFRAARHQAARLRHHRMGHPDADPARNPFADRQIRRQGTAQGGDLVPAVLRTGRRLGRGGHQDARGPRRRRLEAQRAEGVDQRRALLQARSGHRAHRSRRRPSMPASPP